MNPQPKPYSVGDTVTIRKRRSEDQDEGVVKSISRGPLGFRNFLVETPTGNVSTETKVTILPSTSTSSSTTMSTSALPLTAATDDTTQCNSTNTVELEEVELPPEFLADLCTDFFDEEVMDQDDVESFLKDHMNSNTKRKTDSNMRVLQDFIKNTVPRYESTEIETIPPEDLNNILCRFFMQLKKKNGDDYETTSIKGYWASVGRYLKNNSYPCNIHTDILFTKASRIVTAKLKDVKAKGKGNRVHASSAATEDEVKQLYTTGQMGMDNPHQLLNFLWWNNARLFGLRGVTEHYQMLWGDVQLGIDSTGQEYISYTERTTKTRTGECLRNVRKLTPKAWATPEDPTRCPVAAYKLFASKRPEAMMDPETPFYIATTTLLNPKKGQQWFKCQRVGKNKISSLMKNMSKKAKLSQDKKLTPHSSRKTMIQDLINQDVPPSEIMQLTGHANVQSLNAYATLSEDTHKRLSNFLTTGKTIPASTSATKTSTSSTISHSQIQHQHSCVPTHVPHPATPAMFAGPMHNCSMPSSVPPVSFSGPMNNCTFNFNISPTHMQTLFQHTQTQSSMQHTHTSTASLPEADSESVTQSDKDNQTKP